MIKDLKMCRATMLLKRLLVTCCILFMYQTAAVSVTVNSISELKTYLDDDDVSVTMTPGTYTITADDGATTTNLGGKTQKTLLYFSGNNSSYDFTGVTIKVETAVFRAYGNVDVYEINTSGNNNVIKNLTLIDDGSVDDDPYRGACNIVMDGSGNLIEGFHVTIKGSSPYGYGDAFGKGAGSIIGHNKHSACLVRGESNHVKNCTFIHRSYGHCIFFQAASNPLIEDCYIEGEVRTTDDMLAEEGTGSAADNVDFMAVWGYRLPPGFMMSLAEEGIRAYGSGNTIIDGVESSYGTINPTIRNCTIKFMRFGVNLGHATGTKIATGITTVGCELGISADDMTGSTVDVSYGPLSVGGANNETKDITITQLVEPYNGSGRMGYISGTGSDITIRCDQTNVDQSLKLVVSGGYNTIGFQPSSVFDYQDITTGSDNTINNLTLYPMVLGKNSSNNVGVSGGMVIDLGSNNNISHIALSVFDAEAEDYTSMYGITTDTTTDEEAGEIINSINVDDWMEYEIEIPYSGTYSIDYRVASALDNNSFTLNQGDSELEQVLFDNTGDTWTTVRSTTPLFFEQGTHSIKLTATSADWKLNRISIMLECTELPIVPYVESFSTKGISLGKVQARDLVIFPGNTASLAPEPAAGGTWSWSGPNDFTSEERVLNLADIQKSQGGEYRVIYTNPCGLEAFDTFNITVVNAVYFEAEDFSQTSGVTREASNDVSGDSSIAFITSDDWVEYDINVPFSALYSINYRVASENTNTDFEVSIGTETIDNISFNSTSQTWETVSSSSLVYLKAGAQKLRLSSKSTGWKMNWVELEGLQDVAPCALPYRDIGFRIYRDSINWTSGVMDITCEEEVSLNAVIKAIGTIDSTMDYLNVYYKIDGGERIPLVEMNHAAELAMYSAEGISASTLEILVEANESSLTGYFTLEDIYVVKPSDPFTRIEAEDFDDVNASQAETTTDTGGGQNMGYIQTGSWLMYKSINLSEVHSINMRLASGMSGGSVEIRLDSPTGDKIGGFDIPNTGDWQKWVTLSEPLDHVVGFYDVCLVFASTSSYVGNINWLEFSATKIGDETEINDLYTTRNEIQLFPNPVSQTLHFKTISSASIHVDIYNVTGISILSSQLSMDNKSIDVSNLRPGIYYVRIAQNGKLETHKIIKQ